LLVLGKLFIGSPSYTVATACMVYVQRYSLYARQDSILAEELERWKLNITAAEKAKKYGEV